MPYSLGRMLSLVVATLSGFCLLLFSLPYAMRAMEGPAHRLPPGLGLKWLSCALLLALSIYGYVALGRLLRERERADLEAVGRLSRFEADGRPVFHGLLSLALAALMAFGAWAGANDGRWWLAGICAAVLAFLVVAAGAWVRQLRRPGPLLAMDGRGLEHAMFGVIPWSDVIGLSLREVQTRYVKVSTLQLGVRMPHRFLAQAPWMLRWSKRDWPRTRPEYGTLEIPFSFWTIVVGHATFCVVVIYNNAVARLRRLQPNLIEASMDLGADGFQTLRHVVLPQLGSALLAGALLAFALSFDEVIVTTFTAGQQTTLPIWMLQELIRPRQRPVTNVVAVVIIALTFLPILLAYLLTRADEPGR